MQSMIFWSHQVSKKLVIEMFPESYLALQKEVAFHPELVEYLQKPGKANDVMHQFAEIASFAGVVLDGFYTQAELTKLADVLVNRLQDLRGVIRVSSVH